MGEVYSFERARMVREARKAAMTLTMDPVARLVSCLVEMGMSREQQERVRDLTADCVEMAYTAGFDTGVREYRHTLARETETIEREAGESIGLDIPDDVTVDIPRTDEEMDIVRRVSDFIRGLPLDTESNDALVGLLTEMQSVIVREQYMQGFSAGSSCAQLAAKSDI